MRKSLIRLPLALGLVVFSGWLAASPMTNLLGQLSQFDYQDYVGTLQDFGTRYYNTQGNVNATNYLAGTLNSFGLSVRQDAFDYGGTRYNVEATLPGLVTPNQIFIIGAHFDSTSNDPQTSAPGADDNASGTAAMLEIASVLSQYQFASTIRFIGFNAEEQGLIGSQAYAAAAKVRGDAIVGMLNLDMIAFSSGNTKGTLELIGDQSLLSQFIDATTAYVTGLPIIAYPEDKWGSDHYPFLKSQYQGSSALLAIEDYPWRQPGWNPTYHTTADSTNTPNYLDYGFGFKVTQASAATLADLAGLIPEPPVMLLLLSGLLLAARGRRGRGH